MTLCADCGHVTGLPLAVAVAGEVGRVTQHILIRLTITELLQLHHITTRQCWGGMSFIHWGSL